MEYAPTKATVPASVRMQLSESFASPTGVSPGTGFSWAWAASRKESAPWSTIGSWNDVPCYPQQGNGVQEEVRPAGRGSLRLEGRPVRMRGGGPCPACPRLEFVRISPKLARVRASGEGTGPGGMESWPLWRSPTHVSPGPGVLAKSNMQSLPRSAGGESHPQSVGMTIRLWLVDLGHRANETVPCSPRP